MKIWNTKYALTRGILEQEAKETSTIDMVKVYGIHGGFFYGEGKEWHRTRESAIYRAEVMREKKIERLQKQIDRLENLEFT